LTTIPDSLSTALSGRYRLERELGRGGMATVYAAEDVRHRRPVAIKVLHPELGAMLGGERFLREIEVTARLRHPHILPLHDSGEADGLLYYVMPYVRGESLRERLRRERQLPVDEAVRIAREVAGALDSAHRQGVIHRDVKPENILLDEDGHAAVADFGVARAVQRAAGGDRLTATGMAVGTPHYMSPEQASGDGEIGPRSDVWALGCVLYEMLAGEPPFTGASAQSIAAKVMTETPRPLAQARRAVPPHVAAAVERALEKVPADRFATAGQFGAALAAPASLTPGGTAAAPPWNAFPSARLRRTTLWFLALVAAVGLGAGAATWWSARHRSTAAPGRPARFTLSSAGSERLDPDAILPLAISADGRTIAYVGRTGAGRQMLYVRPMNELRARPVPGTEGELWTPCLSPDGRWVAFVHNRRLLQRVPVAGGEVTTIAQLPEGEAFVGGAWAPNGTIVVGTRRGLFRVAEGGGALERMTAVDSARGEQVHGAPHLLPDGRTIVFGIWHGQDGLVRLGVASLDAGGHTTLDLDGVLPFGVTDGRLLYSPRGGPVMAVPFDVKRRRVTGAPVTVLADALVQGWGGVAAALSDEGTLVYGHGSDERLLTLVDERGNPTGGRDEPRPYASPRISPDGQRVALELTSRDSAGRIEVWVHDLTSGILSRLTSEAPAFQPAWSADGRYVFYLSERGSPRELWRVPADGSGPEERVYALPDGETIGEMTVSPDGTFAVLVRYRSTRRDRDEDLWLLTLDTGRTSGRGQAVRRPQLTPLLRTPFDELTPRVSPDGRWLAYISNETGQYEVYVRALAGPAQRIQVSSGGGSEPVWGPDGRRLFYRAGGRFIAAQIATSPGLAVATREPLFEDRYRMFEFHQQYDVHPDGRRFLVLQPAGPDQEIVVVVNWIQELRARTGAGTP
jgi:eukaryotic-like serine/threonine-protein kinase